MEEDEYNDIVTYIQDQNDFSVHVKTYIIFCNLFICVKE